MSELDRDPVTECVVTVVRSFDDYYETHWKQIARLAAALIDDLQVAEDLAQESFARLYSKFSHVEFPDRFVRRTLLNLVKNEYRYRDVRRRKQHLLGNDAATVENDWLDDVLGGLTARRRSVLALRYFEGLDDRVIAEILGIKPSTVRSIAQAALAEMRGKLK